MRATCGRRTMSVNAAACVAGYLRKRARDRRLGCRGACLVSRTILPPGATGAGAS